MPVCVIASSDLSSLPTDRILDVLVSVVIYFKTGLQCGKTCFLEYESYFLKRFQRNIATGASVSAEYFHFSIMGRCWFEDWSLGIRHRVQLTEENTKATKNFDSCRRGGAQLSFWLPVCLSVLLTIYMFFFCLSVCIFLCFYIPFLAMDAIVGLVHGKSFLFSNNCYCIIHSHKNYSYNGTCLDFK